MELVHVDILREERLSQRVVFACDNGRTSERHPGNVSAHITGHHILVVMEAAGADDYAASSFVSNGTFGADCFYAGAVVGLVAKKFDGFRASMDRNVKQLAFIEHIADKLIAARGQFAADFMASAKHRGDLDVNRLPFHMNSVSEPLNDIGTLFGKHFGENRVASIHRDFHQIVVEIFDRVFDAVASLDPGVCCVEVAAGINGVAERSEHFFEDDDFCAEVGSFNGNG